jgi:hypothetical protein
VRYRIHAANTIRENRAAMIFEICWILAMHLPSYIQDPEFLASTLPADHIDQLLHSIYVYGAERVLSVMLLQNLHQNDQQAMQLLEPGDPTRARYLEFILQSKTTQAGPEAAPQDLQKSALSIWKVGLGNVLSRLRAKRDGSA